MRFPYRLPRPARLARLSYPIGLLCVLAAWSCSDRPAEPSAAASPPAESRGALTVVASFPERQITGIAVSREGRLFVNAPFWPGQTGTVVLELTEDGRRRAYPDDAWFGWTAESGLDPSEHFVCVQSVWIDGLDRLWILDPASPGLAGVVEGGPKLVVVDLAADRVERVYRFDASVAPADSYLNDVRVDPEAGFAYLTDSGAGGLVVLSLEDGAARRVLDDHPSTHAEPGVVPEVGGVALRTPDGRPMRVHADGIALGPGGEWVYYHALTGRHLYRVPTPALRDPSLSPDALAASVEDLGATVVTDGMLADEAGNVYHTALELDAIVRRTFDGTLETVVEDPRIAWPDSLARDVRGRVYFTTSQIHRSPLLGNEAGPRDPYRVFRIDVGEQDR